MKVREAFQILTQGVEMMHYDVHNKRGPSKSKKIVWMVPYIVVFVDLTLTVNISI